MRYPDGDEYEGSWAADEMEGPGTHRFAESGEAHVSRRRAGQPAGAGAAWSADRLQAWRLLDGELVRRGAASAIPRAGRVT